jgi:hypothetical protein
MAAPILEAMDQIRIKEGAGTTFATEETVVQAVVVMGVGVVSRAKEISGGAGENCERR